MEDWSADTVEMFRKKNTAVSFLWAIFLVGILRMHSAGLKITRLLAKSKPGSKLAATLYASSCLRTKRVDEATLTYTVLYRW